MPVESPVRPAIALGGAATIAVGVAAVVLLFGIRQPPSLDRVEDTTDGRLRGSVAYVHDDESGRSCVTVLDLGARERRDVTCSDHQSWYGNDLTWTDAGALQLLDRSTGEEQVVVVDAATGEELERRPVEPGDLAEVEETYPTVRPDGREVTWDVDDGRVELLVDGETVWRARGPRDYALWSAEWSPDGAWIVVDDSEGRLFAVSAAPPTLAVLLADAGSNPAWWIGDD